MNTARVSIRISASDWASLRQVLFTIDGNENAAALLCGSAKTDSGTRFLVRRILPAKLLEYADRTSFHLEVTPGYYNRIVDEALRESLAVVIVHSHPYSGPAYYSRSDDYGESRLLPVLESLIPGHAVASLLVSLTSANGRSFIDREFVSMDSLTIVGQRTETITFTPKGTDTFNEQELFNRQIRAFGIEGQKKLGELKIAVIGTGGTGSIVAEQFARAGVQDLILVDPDVIETSNVSRLFGSLDTDVGAEKVAIASAHLQRLGAKKCPSDF